MISLGKWMILTPLQKFPINVCNLDKLIVAKSCPESKNRQIRSHWLPTETDPTLLCRQQESISNVSLVSLKMAIPASFSLFLSLKLTGNKCSIIKFADDWIQSADLWYRKWQLYQLSHFNYPSCWYFSKISFKSYKHSEIILYDSRVVISIGGYGHKTCIRLTCRHLKKLSAHWPGPPAFLTLVVMSPATTKQDLALNAEFAPRFIAIAQAEADAPIMANEKSISLRRLCIDHKSHIKGSDRAKSKV